MSFMKLDNCKSIAEVIERNTSVKAEEFVLLSEKEPFIKNLKETVELILNNKGKPFHIVGDYDTDGVCATAIMEAGLRRVGIHASTRLPKRFSEGYGLSKKIIDEIDSGVIITVDNGIAAHDAIKAAKEKGLIVIVTDHHLAPENENGVQTFPPADIIVDPSVENESEFHAYCGAAVAYRIVKELAPAFDMTSLMILASIATVADVMPLVGANRKLVIDGLKAVNSGKGVTGLRVLLQKIKLTSHITEDDYGFKLGPIFNASGRLLDAGAEKTLDLLKARPTESKIPWMADELIRNNEQRKKVFSESMVIAEKLIDRKAIRQRKPIVIYHPEWGEGIIGLIAGEYCERYKLPTVVFTRTHDGKLKGSARSTTEVHLKNALDCIQDKMIGYGGHAGAAGLSIEPEMFESFKAAFTESCGKLKSIPKDFFYDLELDIDKIQKICDELEKFAPFGEGNPKIRFLVKGITIEKYREIRDNTGFLGEGKGMTIVGFDLAKKYEKLGYPKEIDCVGSLKESWFNGKKSYKFEIMDLDASF